MPRPALLLALSFLPLTACWVSEEEVTDLDGDGYTSTTGDCSENDPAISPGATELCDGIDNDCDGLVDDADAVSPGSLGSFYADVDADGFGGVTSVVLACAAPVGFVENATDCDDRLADVFPGAAERCNGRDDDCDQLVDDDDDNVEPSSMTTFHADSDGDDFGDPAVTLEACDAPRGYVDNDQDCDDEDHDTNPEADEVCDALDNDCDGATDDADPDVDTRTFGAWFADVDGDGFGDPDGLIESCAPAAGEVANAEDCDDAHATAAPGLEEVPYDSLDNDCDARTDDDDLDGDGFPSATDCDDGDADVNPYAVEACDGADNDCDGATDDADADVDTRSYGTWFADADGDGFGDATTRVEACGAPAAYVSDRTDCDDTRAAVNPDGLEVEYDGLNNDCDSATRDDDLDEDGFRSGADCDDADADVNPAAAEVCGDGVDNDCNPDSGCGGSDLEATDADVIIYGDSTVATYAGSAVSGAGDVNGDGLADIIIGAPYGQYSLSGSSYSLLSGAAYVVTDAASSTGFRPLSAAASRIEASARSEQALRAYVGKQVASVGDIDGDGMAEVAVGVHAYTTFSSSTYTGSYPAWTTTTQTGTLGGTVVMDVTSGTLNVSSARLAVSQDAWPYPYNQSYGGMGVGGDLTGDGVPDIVSWTSLYQAAYGGYVAIVRVVSGSASGSVSTGTVEIRLQNSVDPGGSYQGLTYDPVIGDLNGDGHADLLVTYYNAMYGWYGPLASSESMSSADVRFTSPGTAATIADLTGDGVPDLAVGGTQTPSTTVPRAAVTLYDGGVGGTVSSADAFGQVVYNRASSGSMTFGRTVAAGDVTGDGNADLAFSRCYSYAYSSQGIMTYTVTTNASGAVTGSSSSPGSYSALGPQCITGVTDVAGAAVYVMAGPLAAGETDSEDGAVIEQTGDVDSFGASIAIPGDVNGDGIDDLLIGDPYAYSYGAAYLFFGLPGE